MENLAERLFCDLRNANVKIEAPLYVQEGARIGFDGASNQYFIAGKDDKYICGEGLGWLVGVEFNLSFTEAYNEFLEKIKALGHVKFYSMVVPNKAVEEAKLEEFENVVSRYIKDYLPQSDKLAERWDVLVKKID